MSIVNEEDSYGRILLKRICELEYPSDKVLLVAAEDDKKFPIHSIVLAAASKYFMAAFAPNYQESRMEEFVFEGADGIMVKAIVDFCYTGKIDLIAANAEKFLAIASGVQLDLLEERCLRFYNDTLNVNNSVSTMIVADKYSNADLRQRAFDIVRGKFEMVPATEILELDHRSMCDLLKCDNIQATEDLVLTRLLDWFHSKEKERKQYMPKLLELIRLKHITSQFLGDKGTEIYENLECFNLVFSEYKRRALNPCLNIDVRRFRSIFCLFRQNMGSEGTECSSIKIEKYNNLLSSYEEAAEITLADRIFFNAILLKNKLFVPGGRIDDVHSKCMASYDLDSCTENLLPDMNIPRQDCTPIAFRRYIFVFGGDNGKSLNDCERFDSEKSEWKEMKAMNVPRSDAAAAVLNGFIYVAGGTGDFGTLNSVELYDPKCDEWIEIKSINEKRSSFALTEWNGYLYAMGGGCPIIEKYDPWKNCWMKIGSFDECDLITGGINVDGQIFVIMRNGKFGEVKIDESNQCSFVLLAKSKFETHHFGKHLLFQN